MSLSHLTLAHRFHPPPAGLSTCHGGGDSSSLEMTSKESFSSLGSPEMGPEKAMAGGERAEHPGTAPGVLNTWWMFSEYPLWQPPAQVLPSPDTTFGKLLLFTVLEKGPGIKGGEKNFGGFFGNCFSCNESCSLSGAGSCFSLPYLPHQGKIKWMHSSGAD